jgi:hypothetical protein
MRNFASITEDEVKSVYEKTPEVNQYHTWETVKNCEPMYLALKNKIIAHEQEHDMESSNVKPIFVGMDNGHNKPVTALAPSPENRAHRKDEVRRSTVTLNENQINQLRNAIKLSRNCLMVDMGNQIKEEALEELARAQSLMNSFHKR